MRVHVFGVCACILCVCMCVRVRVCVQGKWLHVSYMDFILIVLQFGSTGPKCFL